MRSSKPITVTLGPQLASLEARLKSGEYGSASEVMHSALRALDRQDAALDDYLRAKVQASVKDPRPNVPAADVFKRLRTRHKGTTPSVALKVVFLSSLVPSESASGKGQAVQVRFSRFHRSRCWFERSQLAAITLPSESL